MIQEKKVWDPAVRVFHWSLVASFIVAWITADEWDAGHEAVGYLAAALVAFRLLYGLVGTRYARFSQFVRRPHQVTAYFKDMLTGREARYIGHNPAGGAMVLALLGGMALLCFTGWLSITDAFRGSEILEELHELLANLMLILAILHVGGVLLASLRHHENLVRAMINGRKRAPEPGDVD